jgi:hypothetical protein
MRSSGREFHMPYVKYNIPVFILEEYWVLNIVGTDYVEDFFCPFVTLPNNTRLLSR